MINTQLQGAYNPGWKFALAVHGSAQPALLDSNQTERHPIAEGVLRRTDLDSRDDAAQARPGRPARSAEKGGQRNYHPRGENMSSTLRSLVAFAMLALLSAGCSNAAVRTETSGSAGTTSATSHDQALKFAECVRRNGVREFPDPDASGTLTIDGVANRSSLDTSSAAFTQAIAACKDLQPPGFTGHQRTAQQQESALKFAQCIRDNGVKDFPDPTPDGALIDTSRMPGNPGARSIPGLDAAMLKCREHAANAGVVGAR
jgi:hypothetical protein